VGLRLALILIRVLSLVVPRHRRADWREEWEAELTYRPLFIRAFSAIPDAYHLFTYEWFMGTFLFDIRQRIRSLAKAPAFTIISILTIGLCIAANSVVYSLVHSVVLKPLPYTDSHRIVSVYNSFPEAREERAGNSIPDYMDRREYVEAFQEAGLYSQRGGIVGEGEASQHAFGLGVTPSLFRVLGATPQLGRLLMDGDEEPGNHLRVVISHDLWQSFFQGSQTVVGQDLPIDGTLYQVVGVLEEGFTFPTWDAGFWTPFAFGPEVRSDENRYGGGPEMLALLRPGATVELAAEQVEALNVATLQRYPAEMRDMVEGAGFRTVVLTFKDDLVGDFRTPILLLWVGVLFVLLIGCLNIANLLLVRTSSRSREFATQHALGANRARIVQQIVSESLLLAFLGGVLGLAVGAWSMGFLRAFEVYDVPRMGEVGLDLPALAFSFLLILGTGLVAGVVPAVRVLRGDLSSTFFSGSRTITSGREKASLQGLLVSTQVAVTFVLMIGAGLMFTTMKNVMDVDPGFEGESVLGTAVSLPSERYTSHASATQFIDAALDEIRALPTVESAAMIDALPFSGARDNAVVTPEGYTREAGEPILVSATSVVSPGYFEAMAVPLLVGRDFGLSDTPEAASVVIVDQWLADRYWPQGDVVGRRIALSAEVEEGTRWYTVVGVVGGLRQNNLTDEVPSGAVYRPQAQIWRGFFRLAVKTRVAPLEAMPDVRSAIQRVDPGISPFWVVSVGETMTDSLIARRVPMQLLLISAGVAMLLAALGIYGVLSYSVKQRTREIGIRVALGGTPDTIVRLIGRQWLRLVGAGLMVGLVGALSLTRLIAGLLYQVEPTDPMVLVGAMLLLASVALAAYLLPAWRATRVDPVRVLNQE
jgi:putative ABC transport system permease protein